MDAEHRSLRLSVRTILVTTRDALETLEGHDPLAATAARQRARHLLERLRRQVESVDDPDLQALYAEARRLVLGGAFVASWLPVAGLAGG